MLRLRIFSSAAYGGDIVRLEDAINDWLDSAHPAIRQMAQSSLAEHVVVTFLFEGGHRDARMRATSAVVPEAFERVMNDLELDPAEEEPTLLPNAELPY